MTTLRRDADARAGGFPTGAALTAFNDSYRDTPARLWDAFSVAASAGCGASAAGVVLGPFQSRRGQTGPVDVLSDGDIMFLHQGLHRTPGLVSWTPTGARRHVAATAIGEDPDIGFLWIMEPGDGLGDTALSTLRALGVFATLLYRLDAARGQGALLLEAERHRQRRDLRLLGERLHDDGGAALAAARVAALAGARTDRGDFATRWEAALAGLAAQIDERRVALCVVCEQPVSDVPEPCATIVLLALDELVANAIRHAFPDSRQGTIAVRLDGAPGVLRLEVGNDGVPPAAGGTAMRDGSGLDILARLLAGVRGRLSLTSEPGTTTYAAEVRW
ncbi:ATP-binding protein [Sphingomonas endophytica]|uniref:Histidine kinase/HSP90-like ATPase domain-containing protein n=1 Tax=Sphingomonas endophytica TaxID=869719 RepID=A0A147I6X5_9SPHN|nr:ATP-binding protein [Sphingomonas endophytica]KTT74715.1 hypothetical protein NS334_04890 [Sphingomonas endophytica]